MLSIVNWCVRPAEMLTRSPRVHNGTRSTVGREAARGAQIEHAVSVTFGEAVEADLSAVGLRTGRAPSPAEA